jgi:PAS domain S-box-containing protein
MDGQFTGNEQIIAHLAAGEERFRRVFEDGPLGMGLADPDGRYWHVNRRFCELLGYTEEEIIERGISGITHQDDYIVQCDMTSRLFRGEITSFTAENRYIRKDGQVIWGRLTVSRMRDPHGEQAIAIGMVEDITEQKQTQEALRKARDDLERRVDERTAEVLKAQECLKASESRYRELIENQGEGLGVVDSQERFTFANPAAETIFGVGRGGLIGRSLREFVSEEQFSHVLEQTKRRLAGEKGTYELEINRPDETARTLLLTAVPRNDAMGRFVESFGLFFDITELKRAREALAKKHRMLKQLLQSSDHERRMIAYEIHDGLAQQLAAAMMQFQVFADRDKKAVGEAVKVFDSGMTLLKQAHFEARRLIAGVRPPVLDELGVVEAVTQLVNELEHQSGPRIKLTSNVPLDRLAPILENSIYRICQEALTNAVRHSKSEKVRVSLSRRNGRIRIDIRDWGIGFDLDEVPQNRYGLESIRQRSRLLGGKCGIRSAPGQGTRVVVELPIVKREVEE